MKWEAEEKGYTCNDCFLSMQNCQDMSICCEDETGLCDYFEEMREDSEAMDDLISRRAVIDLWEKYHPTIAVDAMQYDAELRQLPPAQPEPCDDAVSRKAVQYLLAHFVDEDKYVDACDGLKHLPPVTPKQGSGYWILGAQDRVNGIWAKCSACGKTSFGGGSFCRECGAKMKPYKGKE